MTGFRLLPTIVLGVSLTGLPLVTMATFAAKNWEFAVKLDGEKVGYHRFELIDEGKKHRLESEAKFDVRFLFFNAFRYRHNTTEIWTDGCLQRIDARTQTNGKELAVKGTTIDNRLVVDTGTGSSALDDCVMTFAYWNPEFLQQGRLLNAQTGEYLDVTVEDLGSELIEVRGESVDAAAYRLTAKKLDLKLWYSSDDEWLALESVAKGGRIIRYELT